MEKIKKYLNQTLSDKVKSDIGDSVFKCLVQYAGQINTTPNAVISSFQKSDVAFLIECIEKNAGSTFDYEYKYDANVDETVIKSIMAFIATYCILKDLKEIYFKNKINSLDAKANITTFPDIDFSFSLLDIKSDTEDICKFFNGLKVFTDSDNQVEVVITPKELSIKNISDALDIFNNVVIFSEVLRKEIQNNIRQAVDKIKQRLRLIYSGLYNSNAAIIYNHSGSLVLESVNGGDIKNGRGIDKYISSVIDTWYTVRAIRDTNIEFGDSKNIEDQTDFTELLNCLVEKSNVYMPYFHLYILRKGKDWFDEYFKTNGTFDTYLIPYLTSLNNSNFSKVIEALLQGFTQFMALTSVNSHTFLIRGTYFLTEPLDAVSIEQKGNKMWTDPDSPFYIKFQENSRKYVAGSLNNVTTLATLLQEGQKDYRDIVTVTYIYNKKMYEKENLFAYKLYSGPNAITPSVLEPVIGVKMDGSLYRKNIFSSNFTNIIAGSRSGKGTLTMSLLAPLLMDGKPIVYLDNKADIAALFWNLENQISNMWGKDKVKFLAIDAKTQEAEGEKDRPGRVYRNPRHINDDNLLNIPTIFDDPDNKDWLKLLRNLKIIQLFLLLGYIEPVKGDLLKDDTYIFVDEITDYFNRLNNGLYRMLNFYQDDEDPELHGYLDKVSIMIDSIKNDFGVLFSTMKGKRWAKFKFVSIGQSLNLKEWNLSGADNTNGKKKYSKDIGSAVGTPFGYALQTEDSVTWLSGKGQALLDDYSVTPAEKEFLRDGKDGVPGSFIVHTQKPKIKGDSYKISKCAGLFSLGAKKSITDYTFIRTYFALVSNDITSEDINIILEKLDEGEKVLGDYLESQKFVKYTYMFLNNVYLGAEKDGMVQECINTALNDIYDFENQCPRAAVGFDGLLNLLLEKKGIDIFDTSSSAAEELFAKWNRVYEVLYMLVSSVFPNRYTTLEEYLFDVSGDSIYPTHELLAKYKRTNTKKEQKQRIINQRVQEIQPTLEGLNEEEKEKKIAEAAKKVEAEVEHDFEEEERKAKEAEETKIKQALMETFMKAFNAKKGKVSLEITKKLQELKREKDLEAFDRKKDVFCSKEYKDSEFKSQFEDALNLVIDNPIVYAECDSKVDDFINGQYASIDALTFNDTDAAKAEKEKQEKEEAKAREKEEKAAEKGNLPEVKKGKGKVSPATFNGQTISSEIDTGDMEYNTRKIDSMGNVKASRELTNRVIRDIKDQFGGVNNIDEICINANGALIINGYGYTPKFGETFMNSLGLAIKAEVQQGRIGRVVNLGQVVGAIMGNIYTLDIECPKTANSDVFQAELGVRNRDYGRLFRNHRNLQTIYLPDQELTRDNPNAGGSGMGLGAKLAGLFGFGRGNRNSDNYVPNTAATNNGNSFIDQMYQCKPVRILANAFGWTAGCQLVYLAATMLGPWGLVFGAFAAVGAYKEAKNGNQNNRNNNGGYSTKSRNGSSTGGSGSSTGGSRSSKNSGQKSKTKKTDDEDW